MSEKYSVPVLRKIGYSIGHTLNDLTAAVWFTYLIAYFYNVREFDSMTAGYLMLVGQVADAVFTPLIGLGSDKYGGFCLGKRQSWHLIGVIFIIISFPFIFIEVIDFSTLPKWSEFVFYSAAVVFFQFGWASVQVSHLAMIPELTDIKSEKVQLNGLRYAVTVVCTLFVYLFAWLLFHIQKGKRKDDRLNKEDGDVFRNLTIAVIGLGLIASIIFYILAREKKSTTLQRITTASSKKWKDWLKYPKFYKPRQYLKQMSPTEVVLLSWLRQQNVDFPVRYYPHKRYYNNKEYAACLQEQQKQIAKIAVIYMCTRIVVNISQVYIPMYITDSLRMKKDSVAIVPLVVYVSQFLSSLFMRNVNKKIGRKRTFCIGQLFIVGACIWIYFINKDGVNQVYGVAALIGMGGATVLVTSLAMTSDLIGDNSGSGAFVYGCVSCTDKLGNGVAVVLIQFFNSCSRSSDSQNCTNYYRNVLIGVPGGVTVFAFLVLLTMVQLRNTGSYKLQCDTIQIANETETNTTNITSTEMTDIDKIEIKHDNNGNIPTCRSDDMCY